MNVQRIRKTVVVAAAVSALALAGAAPAAAASTGQSAAPAGAGSVTAVCTYRITGDGVRFWTQPGSGTVLGLFYVGDTVTGDPNNVSGGYRFVYSGKHGRSGWVSTGYTSRVGLCAE